MRWKEVNTAMDERTRQVWRYFLFPYTLPNTKCVNETRCGWQRVNQWQRMFIKDKDYPGGKLFAQDCELRWKNLEWSE